MNTTHEIDGDLGNDYWFNATVGVDWIVTDEGIGYYEYGDGIYNHVDNQWELEDWHLLTFDVYDNDEIIFTCHKENQDTKECLKWVEVLTPLVDLAIEDLEVPDELPYEEEEEYDYYDPDGTH
jgi:hypothetical protein